MSASILFDCHYRYPSGFEINAQFQAAGNVIALSGPSGSGKTTLLLLIAGLLKPKRGVIAFGDDSLVNTEKKQFVPPHQRHIGMVFQDYCLFPHLRVRDNILYGARRRSAAGPEYHTVVKTLELTNLVDRFPAQLSGGQKQRVALARALCSGARLLLLDEPVSALESDLGDRIGHSIREVVSCFNIPTIVVSHNGKALASLADQVIFVESGRTHV